MIDAMTLSVLEKIAKDCEGKETCDCPFCIEKDRSCLFEAPPYDWSDFIKAQRADKGKLEVCKERLTKLLEELK